MADRRPQPRKAAAFHNVFISLPQQLRLIQTLFMDDAEFRWIKIQTVAGFTIVFGQSVKHKQIRFKGAETAWFWLGEFFVVFLIPVVYCIVFPFSALLSFFLWALTQLIQGEIIVAFCCHTVFFYTNLWQGGIVECQQLQCRLYIQVNNRWKHFADKQINL